MYPVLFSIGSFHLFSFSLFLILAWFSWSFFFWRYLRNIAIKEDTIFDIMFYTTITALITARLFFVFTHIPLFADEWLKVVALWVQPGLSFVGGLIGAMIVSVALAIKHKVRIAYVVDACTHAFPLSFIFGSIGAFLDGSSIGKLTTLPWGVPYVGHIGPRHPVQLYEVGIVLVITLLLFTIVPARAKRPWPYGRISMWFFTFFAIGSFLIEFLLESDVYWGYLSANQWIYVGILGQTLGAFYVRGGGKEQLRTIVINVGKNIKHIGGKIYDKFPKRSTRRNSDTP